jgi:phasin family protein
MSNSTGGFMQQEIVTQFVTRERTDGVVLAFQSVSDMYAGFGKLVELNLQTLKTSIAEQQALLNATLSAQSLGDAIEMQTQILPATLKKQHAYWRHVGEIVLQTQSEVLGCVFDYTERVGSTVPGASELAQDGPALVLPAELAGADGGSGPTAEATPVTIVDSAGNSVSTTGSGDVFH